jgi:transporter family-2 protein
MLFILPILALLAGVSAVTQATFNAKLGSDLASWSWAALTSYFVGTLAMLIVFFVQRAHARPFAMAAAVPRWAWSGGCLGAVYVVLSIVLLQRLGASAVVAFVVAGQMLGALAFDQFGLMGLPRNAITSGRGAAARGRRGTYASLGFRTASGDCDFLKCASEAGHGNDRVWKAWKATKPAFHPSPTPWKSLRDYHIPTAPTTGIFQDERA